MIKIILLCLVVSMGFAQFYQKDYEKFIEEFWKEGFGLELQLFGCTRFKCNWSQCSGGYGVALDQITQFMNSTFET